MTSVAKPAPCLVAVNTVAMLVKVAAGGGLVCIAFLLVRIIMCEVILSVGVL